MLVCSGVYETEIEGVKKPAISIWVEGKESGSKCFIEEDGELKLVNIDEDFKSRLKTEQKELSLKIKKLNTFLENETSEKTNILNKTEFGVLFAQLYAMTTYETILEKRISALI